MKIIQLIPNISGGGAERFVVDLSNELSKNHEVILVTLYDEREEDLFRDQLDAKVSTISLGKQLGFDWKVIPRLHKVIKNIAPDVIHNHLRTFNYLMPLIPFLNRLPIIHTVHNDAYKECPNPKIRKARNYFYKKGRVVPVTISEESAKSFQQAYGLAVDQMIYNGREMPIKTTQYERVAAEIETFKKDPGTKVFVNIGRIIPQKNQLMLIQAFKRLIKQEDANAILLMMGGGRNTKESREIQSQLEQAEKENPDIHLLGERSNAADYLYVSDYFCLSSVYEGMPITLIEAFATGTIPICTPVGGIPEMLEDLDDHLVSKSVETEAYYQTLKRAYILSSETQQKLKQNASQLFMERYSMTHCAKKYLNLYKNNQ